MRVRSILFGAFAVMTGSLFVGASHAGTPDIFRYASAFDFPIVDCGGFEVWVSGLQNETYKYWYDESGAPVMIQISTLVTEGRYYNYSQPDKFVTQGKNGVGENWVGRFDLTTGLAHGTGLSYRLTIPGIGHVLLSVGTWLWDQNTGTVIHHGPDMALAEGDTGPALCEALQ